MGNEIDPALYLLVLIVGIIAVGILFHSTRAEVQPIIFSFDADGNYTGLSNLPKNYSVEDAKKDGYVVEQDSVVIANHERWTNFVETAAQGNDTAVRMVRFSTENPSRPFFRDLFFNDGYYYLLDSDSDKQDMQPFSYPLTLEGQFGNPLENRRVIVLTNDPALNFNMVMKSLLSSSMAYKQGVPQYKWPMFE